MDGRLHVNNADGSPRWMFDAGEGNIPSGARGKHPCRGSNFARSKHLSLAAAILIAVAAVTGAWVLPPTADAGPTPSVSIEPPTAEAENTVAVTIGWVNARAGDLDDVHVNIPLDEIKDGQFCQGYAVVHVGSPDYYFVWGGQFSNSHASSGWLGPNQIVSGNIDKSRGEWLEVTVWTDSSMTEEVGYAWVDLKIDASYAYNESCEA